MAICEYCLLEMNEANGCRKVPVKTVDGDFDPIPYGSETKHDPPRPNQRCHDCQALPGHYHHVGCDWEECPRCHGQYISCDCTPVTDDDSTQEQAEETSD